MKHGWFIGGLLLASMAGAQDIPGAKAVYEELKTRFPSAADGARRAAPAKPNSPCRAVRGTAGIQSPDRSISGQNGFHKKPRRFYPERNLF
jgi:hypothetical protein